MTAPVQPISRVVTYEDRSDHLVGLKILLLSLSRWSPELGVDVHVPNAPDEFATWMRRVPSAVLHREPVETRRAFDVKPTLLLQALEEHGGTALWLDADLLINGDLEALLHPVPVEELVVTEEPYAMPFQGGRTRSRAWELPTAREFRTTTNTSVIRVSHAHVDLLRTWDEFLGRSVYRRAQQQPWHERPIHLLGAQQVLCALLESEEFADVPVHFLRRGSQIAHCFPYHGYMFHEMVANLVSRRQPELVHCHGAKPWHDNQEDRVHLDVSPYTLMARQYVDELDEPAPWIEPSTTAGRRMVRLSRSDPWTSSLPLAAYREIREQPALRVAVKRVIRRD